MHVDLVNAQSYLIDALVHYGRFNFNMREILSPPVLNVDPNKELDSLLDEVRLRIEIIEEHKKNYFGSDSKSVSIKTEGVKINGYA